jgi:predicted DNA-binding transcriptional regulator AlpA
MLDKLPYPIRRVLRTPAAAHYVNLGIPTLEKFRLSGEGPRFIRLGRRAIGYDVEDLDAWLAERKTTSTSASPRAQRKVSRPRSA